MRTAILVTTSIAACFCVSGSLSPSYAGSPSQCQRYANQALVHYNNMRRFPKCRIANNARWQPSYNNHYGWCLRAPNAWIESEQGARMRHLSSCGAATKID